MVGLKVPPTLLPAPWHLLPMCFPAPFLGSRNAHKSLPLLDFCKTCQSNPRKVTLGTKQRSHSVSLHCAVGRCRHWTHLASLCCVVWRHEREHREALPHATHTE